MKLSHLFRSFSDFLSKLFYNFILFCIFKYADLLWVVKGTELIKLRTLLFVSLQIRLNAMIDKDPLEDIPIEERGKIKDAEINYV